MEPAETKAFLTDLLGSAYVKAEGEILLAEPATAAEIQAILQRAGEVGCRVAVRGGATRAADGGAPLIKISLGRMAQILDLDRDNMLVRVQAGMQTAAFRRELLTQGLYFPPDPLSEEQSTLGGNVATRAAGPNFMNHGETVDFLLGLTAVLPNGHILTVGGKNYKNVAALDLNRFFGGSYGRLGVITEMVFRLLPKPEITRTMVQGYPCMESAAEAASSLTAAGVIPNKLEILDDQILQLLGEGRPAEMDSPAVMIIELEGYRESSDHQEEIIGRTLGKEGQRLTAVEDMRAAALWRARRQVAARINGSDAQMFHVAVPVTVLPEAVKAVKAAGDAIKQVPGLVIHGSAAQLHPVLFGTAPAQSQRFAAELAARIAAVDGLMLTTGWDVDAEGHPDSRLISDLVKIFDPHGIMAG